MGKCSASDRHGTQSPQYGRGHPKHPRTREAEAGDPMSTRKPQPGHANPKGLSDVDNRRLTTFMPDIAHALLPPGTPVHTGNGETRFRRKGSLKLDASGRWYDHEAGTGSRGGLSLVKHLLPPGSPLDARAWSREWLSAHPGTGSLTVESDAETAAREKWLAEYAQRALDELVDITGTTAETYLVRERRPGGAVAIARCWATGLPPAPSRARAPWWRC